MKRTIKLFILSTLGIATVVGCGSSDTPSDDTKLREAVTDPKPVRAEDLPNNVPEFVKEKLRQNEKGGAASAPKPSGGK